MYDALLNSTMALAVSLSGGRDTTLISPATVPPTVAYVASQDAPSASTDDYIRQLSTTPIDPSPSVISEKLLSTTPSPANPAVANQDSTPNPSAETITKYIRTKNKSLSDADLQRIIDHLFATSQKYNLDIPLLMAVMEKESTFNPNATSGGNFGLMQINLRSAGDGISAETVMDIEDNIDYGAKELRTHLDNYANVYTGTFEDEYPMVKAMALTAYNQGSGTVRRGNYTMTYASKVFATEKKIKTFFQKNM